jgi:rhodanese-related sulfurtransferase
MSQNITIGIKQLCDQANEAIETVTVEQAIELCRDENVVVIDIRDVRELAREGRIPGSYHCPRGMVEFWIDPASPYHKDIFAEDKTFIFHCAGGLRSALATEVAQRMGLHPVFNMAGGFGAWRDAGGPVEDYTRK